MSAFDAGLYVTAFDLSRQISIMFFTDHARPCIVAVCVARDARRTAECVRRSIQAGADIAEVNLGHLTDREVGNLEIHPKFPYYVVCRRREFMQVYGLAPKLLPLRDDESRMQISINMLERGAMAVDMECDCFADRRETAPDGLPTGTRELATSARTIAAQRRIIDACKSIRREVVLSCHSGQPLTTDQTLALARITARRGGAVIKIVNCHRRLDYAVQVVQAIIKLKRAISIPFFITSMGPFGGALRLLGCALGNAYVLCRAEGPSAAFPDHLPISAVLALWKAVAQNRNQKDIVR